MVEVGQVSRGNFQENFQTVDRREKVLTVTRIFCQLPYSPGFLFLDNRVAVKIAVK